MHILIKFVFCHIITKHTTFSYKHHSALSNVVFTQFEGAPVRVHSEYYFGKCINNYKEFLYHHTWTYEEIKGKMIVRGWLNVTEEPECALLRARSPYTDMVRYHPLKFNVSICRILYSHESMVFKYFYYEWYIFVDVMPSIEWDFFFYRE